jgi:hypothetical protein
MNTFRVLAFCVLVLTLALVATGRPASAQGPPTVQPLEAVCTAAGGLVFGEVFLENRAVCDTNLNAGVVLSEQHINVARNLCLNAYKADFFVVSGPPGFQPGTAGSSKRHTGRATPAKWASAASGGPSHRRELPSRAASNDALQLVHL